MSRKKYGDVTGDDRIDSGDILEILKHMSAEGSGKNSEWKLKDEKLKKADVNKDGTVNIEDLKVMLRHMATQKDPELAKKHPEWADIGEFEEENNNVGNDPSNGEGNNNDEPVETPVEEPAPSPLPPPPTTLPDPTPTPIDNNLVGKKSPVKINTVTTQKISAANTTYINTAKLSNTETYNKNAVKYVKSAQTYLKFKKADITEVSDATVTKINKAYKEIGNIATEINSLNKMIKAKITSFEGAEKKNTALISGLASTGAKTVQTVVSKAPTAAQQKLANSMFKVLTMKTDKTTKESVVTATRKLTTQEKNLATLIANNNLSGYTAEQVKIAKAVVANKIQVTTGKKSTSTTTKKVTLNDKQKKAATSLMKKLNNTKTKVAKKDLSTSELSVAKLIIKGNVTGYTSKSTITKVNNILGTKTKDIKTEQKTKQENVKDVKGNLKDKSVSLNMKETNGSKKEQKEAKGKPPEGDQKGGNGEPPSGSDSKGGNGAPPSGSDSKGGNGEPPSGSDSKGGNGAPPSGSDSKGENGAPPEKK